MYDFLHPLIPWLGEPWSITTAALVIAVSAVFLALGADWTVDSSVSVANHLDVSPHVVGLTLVAVGTSAPEFAVSIAAATEGRGDMAMSNVVGSNIFNLGFILGGVALLRPLDTDASTVWRDGSVLLGSAVLAWLLFAIDLESERINGILLLGCLLIYLKVLLGASTPATVVEDAFLRPRGPALAILLARMTAGILIIVTSAEFLVEAASTLAGSLGVSEWTIGVTIVAAGTSLPEFTTSLLAAVRGHHGLGLGNVIGSDVFNVLGVLGLTAIIQPMAVRPEASGSMLALVGMVVLVVVFMRRGWRITRWEGAVLVAVGMIRWVADLS